MNAKIIRSQPTKQMLCKIACKYMGDTY